MLLSNYALRSNTFFKFNYNNNNEESNVGGGGGYGPAASLEFKINPEIINKKTTATSSNIRYYSMYDGNHKKSEENDYNNLYDTVENYYLLQTTTIQNVRQTIIRNTEEIFNNKSSKLIVSSISKIVLVVFIGICMFVK